MRRVQSLPAVGDAVAQYEFEAAIRFQSQWAWGVPFRRLSNGWPAFYGGDFVADRD